MLERFLGAARRYVRTAPAALLTIGVGSYGVSLWQEHVASTQRPSIQSYVQRFGSAAMGLERAHADRREGTLFLDAHDGKAASATWRVEPRALQLTPVPGSGSSEVFIAGPVFAHVGAHNVVRIQIDDSTVATFRTSRSSPSDRLSTVAVAPVAGIDVPPRVTFGFRFPIAPGACPTSGCTLRISVNDIALSLQRVGLLYTIADVGDRPLWKPSGAWIVALAAVLAVTSHLVLSLRRRTALPRLG